MKFKVEEMLTDKQLKNRGTKNAWGSFVERARYFFDEVIASGTGSILLLLTVSTLVAIVIIALLLSFGTILIGEQPDHFGKSVWEILAVTLDSGHRDWKSGGLLYGAIMLVVAILGLLLMSTLIGVMAAGVNSKLYDLRRGRSFVIETDHTLILGWSTKIPTILRQIIIANEDRPKHVVVIMAMRDKVEMEEEIKELSNDTKSTIIICRSGNPSVQSDLEIGNPSKARSIIVLSPTLGERSKNADANNIKSIFSLFKIGGFSPSSTFVVEMLHNKNVNAVRGIFRRRFHNKVHVVRTEEIVMRILIQAASEPGLSYVYDELLSFEGEGIYFEYEPRAEGKKFSEISFQYENSVIIGLSSGPGHVLLNPHPDTLIEKGQRLIAIAENANKVIWSEPVVSPNPIFVDSTIPKNQKPTGNILILGWNSNGKIMIEEFTELLSDSSALTIVYDPLLVNTHPDIGNHNISLTKQDGDITDQSVIESIDFEKYNRIVLLSYRDMLSLEDSDNISMLALIHVRNALNTKNLNLNISSEIIDLRNRNLISDDKEQSDFVASEDLAGKILAQISENSEISSVYDEILTAAGPEFHLRSVNDYCVEGESITFSKISHMAMRRNEIAVGYRHNNKMTLNPAKSELIQLKTNDKIVVIAEE